MTGSLTACPEGHYTYLHLELGKRIMEITVNLAFNRVELWKLIESVPETEIELLRKLQAALAPFERELAVYGGASRIQPKENV